MTQNRELLKAAELAERLKVTRDTINKWRKKGTIPAIRINATCYRFDYDEVLCALRGHSTEEGGPR